MSSLRSLAARKRVALQLAKKLEGASILMSKYIRVCVDDGERYPYLDDQRVRMAREMMEYSGYLESVHNNPVVPDYLKRAA